MGSQNTSARGDRRVCGTLWRYVSTHSTEPNLRSASLVRAKDKQGINYDEIVGQGGSGINEAGYPMMINEAVPGKAAGIHKILIDQLRGLAKVIIAQTPSHDFVENVKGNLQASRLTPMRYAGRCMHSTKSRPDHLLGNGLKTMLLSALSDDPSDIANYSGDDVADALKVRWSMA